MITASMKMADGSFIDVAVKAPKMCLLTQGALTDFYEEAKTTIQFSHENVVRCMGFLKEPNELPCLLFEFMEYGSLDGILASNRARQFNNESILKLTNVSGFCIEIRFSQS